MVIFNYKGSVNCMKTNIMGLQTDNITMAEAVKATESALLSDEKQLVVFTPNAEIAYACLNDEKLLETVNSADLVLPDGVGVLRAAEILGTPLKEKVAGVEFGEELCRLCAKHDSGLYILGGKPGVAEAAAENLCKKYAGLRVVGVHNGYFDKHGDENDEVISEVTNSGAEAIMVCFGFPAQENWAAENKNRLPGVKVTACLGGSIDVYSGKAKRAPKLFIKFKLEWLYRLIKEPSRLKRMSVIPKYLKIAKKYKKRGFDNEMDRQTIR